jgi:hypothetical protein
VRLGDLVQLTFASPMMDDCLAVVLKEDTKWNAIVVIATTGRSTGEQFSAYKSNAKLLSSLP